MSNIINFNTFEQQPITAGGTASGGSFATDAAKNAPDCMVVNEGPSGIQILFGDKNLAVTAAVVSASAAGTKQVRIPPGAVMVVNKSNFSNFSVITDSGTSSIFLHAGSGG